MLNDLSDGDGQTITIAAMKEELAAGSSDDDAVANHLGAISGAHLQSADILQATTMSGDLPGHTVTLGGGDSPGMQTLTMSNVSAANSIARAAGGATILQYVQSDEGQVLIPVSALPGGNVQYQLVGASPSVPQGVVMATSNPGGSLPIKGNASEEATRKRELRLLKNREAACECRRKKKEYVKCLENRVAVLENQNKILIEELKSLKELYCQKDVETEYAQPT